MEMPPPPYKKRHLKRPSEFLAGLTSEKLPVFPEHNGDGFGAARVQKLAEIRQRIDTLRDAIDEGWLPSRVIDVEIDHLHRVLSPYHLSRYLADALATLQEAEADLTTWRQMTEAQRDERLVEREREKAEAAERRVKQAEISKQQDAFYSAFFAMGISPIPMSAAAIAESAQALNDAERQISNMGNHLYE